MSNIQNTALQKPALIGRDFRPMLSPIQQIKQTQKLIDENMIISYTRDYGDLFFRELSKSYPHIPMHTRFSKKATNECSNVYIGRITHNLTYSIREGSGLRDIIKMCSPFTKQLVTLKRGPLEYPTVTIHDEELRREENVRNIQTIISKLNGYYIPETQFVLDRGHLEDYLDYTDN